MPNQPNPHRRTKKSIHKNIHNHCFVIPLSRFLPPMHFILKTARILLIVILGTVAHSAFAQEGLNPKDEKNMVSAKKALKDKNWKKALKLAGKGIEKDKSIAEWWYIQSVAQYELSQTEKYKNSDENYFKEAVKSAVKATDKDPDKWYYPDYENTMKSIVSINNTEAMSNYAQRRFAKAIQMYRNSYQLTGDTIALAMLGMSYWGDKKYSDAVRIYQQVTNMNYGAFVQGIMPQTYVREPFEDLSNYYIENKYIDSARRITETGLQIFPKNIVLLRNEKEMLLSELHQASKEGFDVNYRDIVNKALEFFSNDTFFLYQQNIYYLTRMKNATRNKPYSGVEILFNEFYDAKKSAVSAGVKNPTDKFLQADSTLFLFQCLDYYLRTGVSSSSAYFFKRFYATQFKYPEFTEALAEKLLNNPPDDVSKKLLTMLYADAREDYPKNKNIPKYRLAFFKKWMTQPQRYSDLSNILTLNEAVIADFPADKTLKTTYRGNLLRVIDSSLYAGKMYDAWSYMFKLKNEFGNSLETEKLQYKLSVADFEKRYSQTRIYYKTEKGKKTALTGWNGNSQYCETGELPDSTLTKVLHRINYFRQNAGIIAPMALSMDRVQKCQEAAVMFAPKGIFTRVPTAETHQCYTPGAAEAALTAQAILESNPAQCVTIFMNDEKSQELINRRSILNPASLYTGFGSAENNSVFWLLDLGEVADSNYYKTHFVAWPAAGYTPKMLAFSKWSFSIAADLTGAMVTIKNNKGAIVPAEVTQYPLKGMLLNTLIMDTKIEPAAIKAGEYFEVTVELKNKKKYSYRVNFF